MRAVNIATTLVAVTVLFGGVAEAARCRHPHMVPLFGAHNTTCIDAYESNVEWLNATTQQWHLQRFNYPVDSYDADGTTYRATPPIDAFGFPRRPQAYISADQGARACAAANKSLCTLAMFMAGCQGPQGFTFPYGNTHQPGWCNEGNTNPVQRLFPHPTWNLTEMNDPRLDTLPHTLAPAGTFPNCTNPTTKTYDMSGNLDEWVATRTDDGRHGIFKGGYFVDATINGPGCTYETVAHAPVYHDYSLGFRCCDVGGVV